MNKLKLLLCIFFISLIAACSSKLFTVHKIDIQQGNALDTEKVDKVEIGMTQEQVQYVLGSPLITDSFHPDRWDYIYLFRPGYGEKERRQLTLMFDRGEVINIDKHNIAKSDITGSVIDDKKKNKDKKKQQDKIKAEAEREETRKSTKEKKEQKELEEQADALEELEDELDTNAPPK